MNNRKRLVKMVFILFLFFVVLFSIWELVQSEKNKSIINKERTKIYFNLEIKNMRIYTKFLGRKHMVESKYLLLFPTLGSSLY